MRFEIGLFRIYGLGFFINPTDEGIGMGFVLLFIDLGVFLE